MTVYPRPRTQAPAEPDSYRPPAPVGTVLRGQWLQLVVASVGLSLIIQSLA